MQLDPAHLISTADDLAPLYRPPSVLVKNKVMPCIDADFARIIAHSPLAVLATRGADGLDCSPRGDPGQTVFVEDEQTLILPDRPGNNRIDSLRNILHHPQVALLFLVPGVNEVFRVNGTAQLTRDPALLARFAYKDQWPRALVVITVQEAFLHCARALLRADVWNPAGWVGDRVLPNFAAMLTQQTGVHVSDADLSIEDR
ncbi:MSMEG_1061 family FMN-dependent PPOX-type flavoprotein [Deinococcus sonorensis]|uniref:MSMEG_1061 family FMN-dependent PPOX-type flavoprotein n=2 Tax=Deinococcus sonorensis TaxID=309891 RepID=A0AAU7U5L9_9DEIO